MRPPQRIRSKSQARKIKDSLIYPTNLKRSSWSYGDKKKIIAILETHGENIDKILEAFPYKSPLEVFTFLGDYKDYCWNLYWHQNKDEVPVDIHSWISACYKIVAQQQTSSFQDNSNLLGEVVNDIAKNFEVRTPELKEISHLIDIKRIITYLADIINLRPIGELKPYEALLLLSIIESLEKKAIDYKYLGPQLVSHALNLSKLGPVPTEHFFTNASTIIKDALKISRNKHTSSINHQDPTSTNGEPKLTVDDLTNAITKSLEQASSSTGETGSLPESQTFNSQTNNNTLSSPNPLIETFIPLLSQEPSAVFKQNHKLESNEKSIKIGFFPLNPFCLPSLNVAFGLDKNDEDGTSENSQETNQASSSGLISSQKDGTQTSNASPGLRVYGRSKRKLT